MSDAPISRRLIAATRQLAVEVDKLNFTAPVAHVYHPLDYARAAHECYLRRYADGPRRVVFLGMNPGPFGMAQTGVPFGEVAAVRDWLGIETRVGRPGDEHPKRPVDGFACTRSEVSGRRLWGLFASRFRKPEHFFHQHVVMNYCPLAFLETSGRNITPEQLPARQKQRLLDICDQHLGVVLEILQPQWVVGVGGFATARARQVASECELNGLNVGQILHPSPASPAANRDWAGTATRQLIELGVWRGDSEGEPHETCAAPAWNPPRSRARHSDSIRGRQRQRGRKDI